MFIKHPTEPGILEISRYGLIRPCTVNVTHLDFYLKPFNDNKKDRGKPDYIVVFDSTEERDKWFKNFTLKIGK